MIDEKETFEVLQKRALTLLDNVKDKIQGKRYVLSTHLPYTVDLLDDRVFEKQGLVPATKTRLNRSINAHLKNIGGVFDNAMPEIEIELDLVDQKIQVRPATIYIFGRYYKEKYSIAQSKWFCKHCGGKGCEKCGFKGKKYVSIHEIFERFVAELTECKEVVLHASGREDVDVLNLAGRPFVLEIVQPSTRPSLETMRQVFKNPKYGVWADIIKIVKKSDIALVCDSHFDKRYIAETDVDVDEEGVKKVVGLKGKVLKQRTPTRVKHRRTDMVRKRRILDIEILNTRPLVVNVLAEPGTYIKEFVHGDEGRTSPSISEVLGKPVACTSLKVISIHDAFLDDVLGS